MITNWTPEQDAQLVEMIGQGQSASYVAKAMGRSRNAVMGRAYRKALQFKSKAVKPRKVYQTQREVERFTAEEDKIILEMAVARKSGSTIAEVLKRSKSSVIQRARRLGTPLRGKDGPAPKAPTVKPTKVKLNSSNIAGKKESRTHDPIFKHTTPSVPLQPLMVALVDLRPNMCRFPVAGERADTLFCGHPMEQRSYCQAHARISYTAPEMRRKAA